jgi:hypothetical protein
LRRRSAGEDVRHGIPAFIPTAPEEVTMLTILLIIIVLLLLFGGGFGYSRRGRRL